MNPLPSTTVIYHAGCQDGWCAAWVAHRAILAATGVPPVLVAASYHTPLPAITTRRAVFLDFSPAPVVLTTLAAHHTILVLDHHQTAINEVITHAAANPTKIMSGASKTGGLAADLFVSDPWTGIYNTSRSGASLAWAYWHPSRPTPPVVSYTEDRDLWRHDLPDSQQVNAYLRTVDHDLAEWDALAELGADVLAVRGEGATRERDKACQAAARQAFTATIGEILVVAVNACGWAASDLCHHLLDVHRDVNVAACYTELADGRWRYSLRGRPGSDVHHLAGRYGGGGHPQAAGMVTSIPVHTRRAS